MKKEYGGYLPFELRQGQEYHLYPAQSIQRYNSANTAIYYACLQVSPTRVWVPLYLCPDVKKIIQSAVNSVVFYHIDQHFNPVELNPAPGDAVFLVNYFGVKTHQSLISKLTEKQVPIILDNSHDFFRHPFMEKNILNVYSCKKFFGVPDGGYLIGNNVNDYHLSPCLSAERCDILLGSYEQGTNHWYQRKKEIDAAIVQERYAMSKLAEGILYSIDYESIKRQRISNFDLYQQKLGKKNKIICEKDSIPYIYPFHTGKDIKKQLISKKIYVPTLWEDTLAPNLSGTIEYDFSKNTIFLPLDQRYNSQDIAYIINEVEEILE